MSLKWATSLTGQTVAFQRLLCVKVEIAIQSMSGGSTRSCRSGQHCCGCGFACFNCWNGFGFTTEAQNEVGRL